MTVRGRRCERCPADVAWSLRSQRLEDSQVFSTDHISRVLAARGRAEALDAWREAAGLVSTRWQLFLEAGPEGRRWAFASYVAALDAEEAAAAEMAALTLPMAA